MVKIIDFYKHFRCFLIIFFITFYIFVRTTTLIIIKYFVGIDYNERKIVFYSYTKIFFNETSVYDRSFRSFCRCGVYGNVQIIRSINIQP